MRLLLEKNAASIILFLTLFFSLNHQYAYAFGKGSEKGMGFYVLRKNRPLSKQITTENTIYVIKYDFDLSTSSHIVIPANCVLAFEGGSIKNGTIYGNNTIINALPIAIFNTNTNIEGTWNVNLWYPEWFGAEGDGITDDTKAIQKLDGKCIMLSNKTYVCSNLIFKGGTCILGINKYKSCLKQKDCSKGDFIRLENWFAGTLSNIRIEGGKYIEYDSTLWMQSLLKIVNYSFVHNPDKTVDADTQEISTYYSSISNIVIRKSEYTGLAVIGVAKTDKGEKTAYNWIHKISDVWVEDCDEYGIYDGATDNQWSNINVSHCGYSNLFITGSSEIFNNVKLDGESGYKLCGMKSFDILEDSYRGAGLVLTNDNNIIMGLDIQSINYKGIVLDASSNIIVGTINNIGLGFNESKVNQRNCPAIYFYGNKEVESNTLILNVISFSEIVGSCVIRFKHNSRKIINNNINITYLPYKGDYNGETYKMFVSDMREIESLGNTIKLPSFMIPIVK